VILHRNNSKQQSLASINRYLSAISRHENGLDEQETRRASHQVKQQTNHHTNAIRRLTEPCPPNLNKIYVPFAKIPLTMLSGLHVCTSSATTALPAGSKTTILAQLVDYNVPTMMYLAKLWTRKNRKRRSLIQYGSHQAPLRAFCWTEWT
jgi:hypothetical protein